MGLMSAMYAGVSGLTANQRGLTVAGHNLANVETEGYVRQQMETTDSFYRTVGTSALSLMQTGHGTDVSTIKQVRDQFLDKTYREEVGRQNYYRLQYESTTEVEDIFGETEGVAFQDSMEEVWVALQEMCKEPDSIVTRSSFIQTAVSFIERAEEIYKQVGDYQVNLNTQVKNYVNRINDIAKEIYDLNHSIQKIEASGFENANDLRDRRNLLVDELSELVKVSYKEDATGIMTVYVEDYAMVTEDLVYPIDTRPINDETSMIEPYWINYDSVDLFKFDRVPSTEADTDVGALKGLLIARGQKVGRYTDIPTEPTEEDFTDEAGWFDLTSYQAAMRDYNKEVEEYKISVESSVCVSIQAQFDNLIHGIVTTINDLLCPNKEVELTDGSRIKIFDEEKASVGMDENDTPGEALFNRKSVERYTVRAVDIVNDDGTVEHKEAWVFNDEDPANNYSLFTIGEIEVNDKLMKNPSLLPLSDNGGTGDFSIELCESLLSAWQAEFDTISPSDYTKQNFNSYYTEMIGLLGTNGQKYKNVYNSQENLVNSVDNQRQAVHAVDSDEDLTNIIKYQQGYNANSRFINAVNQMLEHLLNTLGR
ncbi:MAG: flagellar hook-associated protein FlgK [Lachnospiraceae bacterium]|nr:flagellar hook-associated protein FlgK [Lachnospiraceae bacterium]